jgi:hypothetical protein
MPPVAPAASSSPETDVASTQSEEEVKRREQAEQERNSPEVSMDVDVPVEVDVPLDAAEYSKPSSAGTLSPEQDREAILRMIAEGRISPEEGDLLLEALGG